ncbi:MAG: hypothetical protein Q9170_004244 [Blastenia crenularia]
MSLKTPYLTQHSSRPLKRRKMRNGVAEILKITSCTHEQTFNLLEEHRPKLLETRFAQTEEHRGSDLFVVADRITRQVTPKAIQSVLDVEIHNSREQILDRVMYFGHTWSPVLELAVHPPLMHGPCYFSRHVLFGCTSMASRSTLPRIRPPGFHAGPSSDSDLVYRRDS